MKALTSKIIKVPTNTKLLIFIKILLSKKQVYSLLFLLIITPLGFATKLYRGPFSEWIANSLGGVFYEAFWCLLVFLLFPKLKPKKIAISVFMITSFLEFLQLVDNSFLSYIRSSFLGRTIIGTSFVASDFIYYVAGCLIGWLILEKLNNLQIPDRHHSHADQ